MREDTTGQLQIILLATGSEVEICLKAAEILHEQGFKVRVVSMPSWELFEEQSEKYRHTILPKGIPVLSVETGITMGWSKYVGTRGASLGIDHFGASGPGPAVMEKFGFTAKNIAERAGLLIK